MHRPAGKRAGTRGDEQETGELFLPVFRRAQKPSGLLGEIDEDRGGVEDTRLPAAGAFGVDDGGNLAVRIDRSEGRRMLLALAGVDRNGLVGQTRLCQKERNIPRGWRRMATDGDHETLRSGPYRQRGV